MLAFHQEDIQTLEEYLHPFPHMEDIFVPEQPWLKAHFLPLISIDLSVLNPEWQGQTVHMITPFEPYEGLIGEDTEAHHNEFTAPPTGWPSACAKTTATNFWATRAFLCAAPSIITAGKWKNMWKKYAITTKKP